MELVDTHAHLDDEAFAGETEALIARAAAAGVTRIVQVGFNHVGWATSIALARPYGPRGLALGLGILP